MYVMGIWLFLYGNQCSFLGSVPRSTKKYFFDLFLSVFLHSLSCTLVLNVRPLEETFSFSYLFPLIHQVFSKISERFINFYLFFKIRFIFQFFCHICPKSNKKQKTVSDDSEYFLYLFEDINNKLLIFSSLYNYFVQVTLVSLYQLLYSYCFLRRPIKLLFSSCVRTGCWKLMETLCM